MNCLCATNRNVLLRMGLGNGPLALLSCTKAKAVSITSLCRTTDEKEGPRVIHSTQLLLFSTVPISLQQTHSLMVGVAKQCPHMYQSVFASRSFAGAGSGSGLSSWSYIGNSLLSLFLANWTSLKS